MALLFAYLKRKVASLDRQKVRDVVGSSYTLLNVKRLAKPSILLLLCTSLRNMGLSATITHGNSSLIFQIFFLNFSSLVILGILGFTRPYLTRGTLWLEIANEFVIRILLLNLLMCQTNFVADMSARSTMAWVFIVIIVLMVILNQGIVILESIASLRLYGRRILVKCGTNR